MIEPVCPRPNTSWLGRLGLPGGGVRSMHEGRIEHSEIQGYGQRNRECYCQWLWTIRSTNRPTIGPTYWSRRPYRPVHAPTGSTYVTVTARRRSPCQQIADRFSYKQTIGLDRRQQPSSWVGVTHGYRGSTTKQAVNKEWRKQRWEPPPEVATSDGHSASNGSVTNYNSTTTHQGKCTLNYLIVI